MANTTMKLVNSAKGTSDPVQYSCTCSALTTSGSVLLFYRYFAASPPLASHLSHQMDDLPSLAAWYTTLAESLNLGGKIRVAKEGFNVTLGGLSVSINAFIAACISHWSFDGLGLNDEYTRKKFFKPSPGCACVFGGIANVKIVSEATPMGVEGYAPASWERVVTLEPEEFHCKLENESGDDNVLLDVRNHYESRIGYFVSGKGKKAVTPQIRRFSQWPPYVKRHLEELKGEEGKERHIMTYCTGGIRCEKGVRFLQEMMRPEEQVFTLKGGIAAYLEWMDGEIKDGRKTLKDSLFKGRNYVFDARGSIGLDKDVPVSRCHVCETRSSRLSKCRSGGCHLVLVVCEECDETGNWGCCQECLDLESWIPSGNADKRYTRPLCACEKERESQLWPGGNSKEYRSQGWRKQQRRLQKMNIEVHIIDDGKTLS